MSPKSAMNHVAEVFLKSSVGELLVREDRAFRPGGYLSLGQIEVFPTELDNLPRILRAVRFGEFEWRTPTLDTARSSLLELLGSGLVDHSQKMTVAARAIAEKKAVGQRS